MDGPHLITHIFPSKSTKLRRILGLGATTYLLVSMKSQTTEIHICQYNSAEVPEVISITTNISQCMVVLCSVIINYAEI